jgi:hypothetical protein
MPILGSNELPPNDQQIEQAIRIARKNWGEWRDVFEHTGPIMTNPLLADQKKFRSFCVGYRVGRTIRKGSHDELRCTLRDSPVFLTAMRAGDAHELELLEKDLRTRFGTKDPTKSGVKRIISLLSKVAAFVRPGRFVAWDQYARRGLKVILGRGTDVSNYPKYLAAFDSAWASVHGEEIRRTTTETAREAVEKKERFQRRVLDIYLMTKGGRDHKPATHS